MKSQYSCNIYNAADIEEAKYLAALKVACENDFLLFCRVFYKHVRKEEFLVNYHHHILCNNLTDLFNGVLTNDKGERTNNLIFCMPPGGGKTIIAIIFFTAWSIAKNPFCRFMNVSAIQERALTSSSEIRDIIQSDLYQKLWPLDFSTDSKAKGKWNIVHRGVRSSEFLSVSMGGGITGFRAGRITKNFSGALLIDDPIKPGDALREQIRNKVNNSLNNTIFSRKAISGHLGTPLIASMQRLHTDDCVAFFMSEKSKEKNFKIVNIPAFIEEDGKAKSYWPEKEPLQSLLDLKEADPATFASQYMQEPIPIEGSLFKVDQIEYYKPEEAPQFNRIIQSWDTAVKDKEIHDYSVCTTWGVTENKYYLLDVLRKRLQYTDLKNAVRILFDKYKPDTVLIEDKATGQALLQELRRESTIPTIPIRPKESKLIRAQACTSLFASSRS